MKDNRERESSSNSTTTKQWQQRINNDVVCGHLCLKSEVKRPKLTNCRKKPRFCLIIVPIKCS